MTVDIDPITDASPTDVDIDERIDVADEAEAADEADLIDAADASAERSARFGWTRLLIYGVLPGLALILALGAGYLKGRTDRRNYRRRQPRSLYKPPPTARSRSCRTSQTPWTAT